MAVVSGTRVGPYEVVALVGSGGMGEVYRARDPRLRREVAIKVIAARSASDPERLTRFEQEARAAATLNHPNILAVYDVGTHEGSPYVVTELLEGESLREQLSGVALPARKAMQFGLQIANGVAAAHEKGIVHRDLKPENVFVTRDERLKILDFGLAKLIEPATAASQLTTVTLQTDPGNLMGTAGYIAPEQVRGEPADYRSDIFGIGTILYEMLTGRRAFQRETVAETLTAILREDPRDILELSPAVPPAFARLVARCLEKRPEARFQSARDLAFALDAVGAASGAATDPRLVPEASSRSLLRRRLGAAAAAIALLSAGFVGGRFLGPRAPARGPVRVLRLTDARGLEQLPAISRDGKSVAFVAHVGANAQIFVRLTASGTPLQITRDPTDHLFPRWSADSGSILYYSPAADGGTDGALWEIPALGGAPRRIAGSLGAGDVSRDGNRIVFTRLANGRLELTTAGRDGSNAKTIAELEAGYVYLNPRWSPGDRLIAYHRGASNAHDVFVVPADGGQARQITQHGALVEGLTWAPDGSIIFSSSQGSTIWYLPTTNLWRVEADGRGLRQLTFGEASYVNPDVDSAGTIVAARVQRQFDIWRYPTDGPPADNVRRGVRITHQTSHVHTPSVAPGDGDLVYVSDSGGHANLWVLNLATGASRQITYERDPAVRVGLPLWSPDGQWIAYFTSRGASGNYFLINPDGSNSRLVARDAAGATWSPDGQWLYFTDYPTGRHLRKIPVTGGVPVIVRADSANLQAIAADGTTLYYAISRRAVSGGSDSELLAARPEYAPSRLLARIPARRLAAWPFQPVMSPDGRWLALALLEGVTTNLWALSTSTGHWRQLTDFGQQPTFITRRVSWSSDGRFIFAAVGEGDSDVVLVEGLKPE